MWHLTFLTNLPVGLGKRSLQWYQARLPNAGDFLELVSLDAGAYWFTLQGNAGAAAAAPMDFVPLMVCPIHSL